MFYLPFREIAIGAFSSRCSRGRHEVRRRAVSRVGLSITAMDLAKISRARLLRRICEASATSSRCVLLCDEQTLRVLSWAVRMSELLEAAPQIALVDSIHSPHEARVPDGTFDVVYFLSPNLASIELALADHEDAAGPLDPAAYGGTIHFIFSRHLPDALLQRLRESSAVLPRVRTLCEAHTHYLPLARGAFSLDAADSFSVLYGPADTAARSAAIGTLAEQIGTVFASLGLVAPRVRYAAQGHPIGRNFAECVDTYLKEVRKREPPPPRVGSDKPRAAKRPSTLLILERGYDPLTPLLHDFSYEALAEGLGVLKGGRYTREGEKADALLHDSDPVWADLRRRPFEQVPDRLKYHSEAFLAEHENILRAQRGEHMSLKQRQEASRAQFAFGFVRRRESLKLQQELVTQMTKMLLSDGGEQTPLYGQLKLEQELATGRGADDGRSYDRMS